MDPSEGYAKWVFGRLTLLIFVVTGVVVTLAEWGLLPRETLFVGAPAIVATLLVDTFLYNEFLIRTGRGFWVFLYAFLFVQSAIITTVALWIARYWSHIRPRTTSK